ncbi:imm11 family protein [Oceanirhabdus sp. W0125-5]|uniref:imm11 family protein n=1 Tax=Oceanirhabdus sp. W0125-5 TaxID=2999116 RepID=UPI0022F2FDAD|nr:DUF1629 domain-containing protein [Oceanirhabdus sp. W0125-5]WBW96093.1 hypothetical protein OW730_20720 [Oceanirhabdus sp. W0125-5]
MKYYKIIDSDEYINPDDIICYTDEEFENKFKIKHYDLNEGRLLQDYSEKIIFYYDRHNGNIPTDYISNDLGWLIISLKFKKILESIGVYNVQYIPIEIREKTTNDILIGYNIVNIIGLVDGLNLNESVYKVLKVRNKEYISVTKPALDINKLKGLHLARVKDCVFVTFVSEALIKELLNNNITGCDFLEVKVV